MTLQNADVDKDTLCRYQYTTRQSLKLSTSSARTRKFETVYIFSIHAASGCDTTSAIYRKDKAAALKTLESNDKL